MTIRLMVRVTRPYTSAYPEPLVLAKGASVSVTPRECEWPGWAWSRTEDDREGWIPQEYLEQSSGGKYILNCDYDATELTVAAGQSLEVIRQVAGWLWCRCDDGQQGWVPAENTEPENPPHHE